MLLPSPIKSKESPRDILANDFKSLRGGLPISGGWGYTKEDACIINRNDPLVDPALPFDGVALEHVFVEKRIYEEMIIFRPKDDKFTGMRWDLQKQQLIQENGRTFDMLVFEVTAFRDKDWEELRAEYEGPQGYGTSKFDPEAHEQKRKEKMLRFTREFWFDITSFFGNVHMRSKNILFVDPNESMHRLFCEDVIERFADRVKTIYFINAEDAYAYLLENQSKVHLIISSICMPQMNGIKFLRICKDLKPRIPFILYTSHERRDDPSVWPADAYIIKSADTTELLDEVDKYLFASD